MNDGSDALRILIQFLRVREADDPYDFRFGPQDYIFFGRDREVREILTDLQALID